MIVIEQNLDADPHRLHRELTRLRAENKHLRERLPVSKRYRTTLATAEADAIELIDRRFSSESTSRQSVFNECGMSERRWYWAVALLRYSGVVSTKTSKAGLDFIQIYRVDALTAVHASAPQLSTQEGYERLQRLLPKSRR